MPTYAVEEQEGTVHWQAPNDLRLDILGRRNASRSKDITLSSDFTRPWFVPRGSVTRSGFSGTTFPPAPRSIRSPPTGRSGIATN